MKKYIALALVFATPAVLADTINMACPPGDKVVIHTVTNNGDLNGDSLVNMGDFLVMQENYGQPTVPASPDDPDNKTYLTDLNGDGTTNAMDFVLFRMLLSQQ